VLAVSQNTTISRIENNTLFRERTVWECLIVFYMLEGVLRGFLGGSVVNNSHTKQDSIPGPRRSLEKEMAPHSSILA